MLQSLFFLTKRDSTQVFFSEYCEIFKSTYFEEHLRTDASELRSPLIFQKTKRLKAVNYFCQTFLSSQMFGKGPNYATTLAGTKKHAQSFK